MIPNISKHVPPVSQYIPLVSAISTRTLSRRLGVKQAWPGYRNILRRRDREPEALDRQMNRGDIYGKRK